MAHSLSHHHNHSQDHTMARINGGGRWHTRATAACLPMHLYHTCRSRRACLHIRRHPTLANTKWWSRTLARPIDRTSIKKWHPKQSRQLWLACLTRTLWRTIFTKTMLHISLWSEARKRLQHPTSLLWRSRETGILRPGRQIAQMIYGVTWRHW